MLGIVKPESPKILCLANFQSRVVGEVFLQREIPHRIKNGIGFCLRLDRSSITAPTALMDNVPKILQISKSSKMRGHVSPAPLQDFGAHGGWPEAPAVAPHQSPGSARRRGCGERSSPRFSQCFICRILRTQSPHGFIVKLNAHRCRHNFSPQGLRAAGQKAFPAYGVIYLPL